MIEKKKKVKSRQTRGEKIEIYHECIGGGVVLYNRVHGHGPDFQGRM
jgi:hypothetical protein